MHFLVHITTKHTPSQRPSFGNILQIKNRFYRANKNILWISIATTLSKFGHIVIFFNFRRHHYLLQFQAIVIFISNLPQLFILLKTLLLNLLITNTILKLLWSTIGPSCKFQIPLWNPCEESAFSQKRKNSCQNK